MDICQTLFNAALIHINVFTKPNDQVMINASKPTRSVLTFSVIDLITQHTESHCQSAIVGFTEESVKHAHDLAVDTPDKPEINDRRPV